MNKYEVFFELYGKKMKTTVEAYDKVNAEHVVESNIIFHKIVPVEVPKEPVKDTGFNNDESFTFLMGLFGLK